MDISERLAALSALRHKFDPGHVGGKGRAQRHPGTAAELTGTADFGSNPGNLRMVSYVPAVLARKAPLVVALHGCGQDAQSFGSGSGWLELAERHGFALLLPEQQAANNPNGCFSWFLPEDTRRDGGEAFSLRQMIAHMITTHGLDRDRIFITGLSAGGAMTSAMLACYPEVFAGGAIVAGLPFGGAHNVQSAFETMRSARDFQAGKWGEAVLKVSNHRGRFPRISVWHGTADPVVNPNNADAIVKQWANVHGVPLAPSAKTKVSGHCRSVWRNGAGDDVIEYFAIGGMGHGVPLAPGTGSDGCGHVSPFHIDAGISSACHIAHFWGLAAAPAAAALVSVDKARDAKLYGQKALVPSAAIAKHEPRARQRDPAPASSSFVQDIIASALSKAGLLTPPDQKLASNDPRGIIQSALRSAGVLKD